LVHVPDFLATVGTGSTDFRTRFAVQGVVFGIARHEVNAGSTGGDAIQHRFHVFLLDVRIAFFQAVVCQHLAARCLAVVAGLNALA